MAFFVAEHGVGPIGKAKTVQVGDTFLLIGGYHGDSRRHVGTIYRYEPDAEKFTLLETRLRHVVQGVLDAVVLDTWPQK